MAPKQIVPVIAAAMGLSAVAAPPNDADVVFAVLNHFASRDDASIRKDGVILLLPRTQQWTNERIRGFGGLRDGTDICATTDELYDQLVKRNLTETPASGLVGSSERWRFASETELEPGSFGFSYKTDSGAPARTMAGLVRPAYSANGETAFLMFGYAWSMHSAIAQYIVERTRNGWTVKCSQLRFYP
jgi:hypothetical protein